MGKQRPGNACPARPRGTCRADQTPGPGHRSPHQIDHLPTDLQIDLVLRSPVDQRPENLIRGPVNDERLLRGTARIGGLRIIDLEIRALAPVPPETSRSPLAAL